MILNSGDIHNPTRKVGLSNRAMQAAWLVPSPVSPVVVLLLVSGGSFSPVGGSRLERCQSTSRHGTCCCYAQSSLMHWRYLHGNSQRGRPTTGSRTACCPSPTGAVAVQLTQPATASFPPWFACWLAMEDVAVNRLGTSITQLTLCQPQLLHASHPCRCYDSAARWFFFFPSNAFMASARSLHTFNRGKQLNCNLHAGLSTCRKPQKCW